jgi:hypothetical protein
MREYNYTINYNDGISVLVTKNESQILAEWYDIWFERMLGRFSSIYIRENFTIEDVIADWCNAHGGELVEEHNEPE